MYLEVIDNLELNSSGMLLAEKTFMVFDLETTGIDVTCDLPVSYAIVTMSEGICIQEGYSIINPEIEIPDEASRIHGISTQRARDCGIVLDDAVQIVTDALMRASRNGWFVVGMNVSFDLSMIDARARSSFGIGLEDMGFSAPILDVMVLDRHYDPFRSGRRTLDALSNVYAVEKGDLHNALEDCKVTYRVLEALIRAYPEIGELSPGRATDVQAGFYNDWVQGYNKWALSNRKAIIEDRSWPIYGA